MGVPYKVLLRMTDSEELAAWIAYFAIEKDPSFGKEPEQTPEQIGKALDEMFARVNARVKAKKGG